MTTSTSTPPSPQDPASSSIPDVSALSSAPKPEGPKRSDPFQFGSRFLLPNDDPFAYNAWDHVDPDPSYASHIATQIASQRASPVSDFDKTRFLTNPEKWWNKFYKNNTANFFKNRKWLKQEFPVLAEATAAGGGKKLLVELGCGAGNTIWPLLEGNENPEVRIIGCDYSKEAVNVVRSQALFERDHEKGIVDAVVYDLSAVDTLPEGVVEGSVDVVIMVFVFSALEPTQWKAAVANVRRMLKPGGKVLFRDYGRGDLAQVRFKKGRYLDENFYVRGDGTRVYFFEEEELAAMYGGERGWKSEGGEKETEEVVVVEDGAEPEALTSVQGGAETPLHEAAPPEDRDANERTPEAGTEKPQNGDETPADSTPGTSTPVQPLPSPLDTQSMQDYGGFHIRHMAVDRRMIVNRKRQIKMYRRWIQAVFEKKTEGVNGADESTCQSSSRSSSSG